MRDAYPGVPDMRISQEFRPICTSVFIYCRVNACRPLATVWHYFERVQVKGWIVRAKYRSCDADLSAVVKRLWKLVAKCFARCNQIGGWRASQEKG